MDDYICPNPDCKISFGYYNGDAKCLRCDEIFDSSQANCPKCGNDRYDILCPDCGVVVERELGN